MNDPIAAHERPTYSGTWSEKNTKPSREKPTALGFQILIRCLFLTGTITLLAVTIVRGCQDYEAHLPTLIPFCLSLLGDPYELAVLASHVNNKRLPRTPMPLVLLYDFGMLASTITGCVLSAFDDVHTDKMPPRNYRRETTILVHGHSTFKREGPTASLTFTLLLILSGIRFGMLILAMVDTVRWAGVIQVNKMVKKEQSGMPTEI